MSEKPLILLAEDSCNDRQLILTGFVLADFPFDVKWVEDGVWAMEYLAGKNRYADRNKFPLPSLLLTDINMPRMNGLELLAWVRAHDDLKDLPVIVVTGSEEDKDRECAVQLGAAYVTKDALLHASTGLAETFLHHIAPALPPSIVNPALRAKGRENRN